MTTDALERIGRQFAEATSYAAIFGALPRGDVAVRRAALRKQFVYLAQLVHPDHAPQGSEMQAGDVFRLLNQTREAAEAAIEDGNYDLPFPAGSPVASPGEITLQSVASTYRLRPHPFRLGDFSALYRGENAEGVAVIAKIAAEPTCNIRLEHEAAILDHFGGATASIEMAQISAFVPRLMDTFLVTGEGNTRTRVNIMRHVPGLVSVAQIIAAYPDGLDPRDAAWICRRMLAQTLAASMAGVVHGAMVPDHILIDPFTHEPLHIGWAHAVPAGNAARITHVIDRYRDFYPPEVFEKQPVDHTADLYMAGKTMLKLLGGNVAKGTLPPSVPKEIARLIGRITHPSPRRRWLDGEAALGEFTRVVRALWGKTYRPLIV